MSTPRQRTALHLAAALALTAAAAHAHADFLATVTATVTPASGGLTDYSYFVANLPASTENVGQFALEVPLDANLSDPTAPAGYIIDYTPGNPVIFFDSTDPSIDLHPGQSETFAFLSPLAAGPATYQLFNYDDGASTQGTTPAPTDAVTVTPEPATLTLLATGLPLAAAAIRRRRIAR